MILKLKRYDSDGLKDRYTIIGPVDEVTYSRVDVGKEDLPSAKADNIISNPLKNFSEGVLFKIRVCFKGSTYTYWTNNRFYILNDNGKTVEKL